MRMFEDMEIIVPKETYKEALKLVKQCSENPQSTCCVVIAGYKAKSKQYYDELRKEWIHRGRIAFDPKDRPWIVAWKHGCGHLWKDNTDKKEHF
jgi:hypothetical protein